MMKNDVAYKEVGQDYYEQQYHDRIVRNLSLRAKSLGFVLIKNEE
jgi:hypothetical protein